VSFPRLPTTRHIHPFFTQTVTQGHVHLPPRRIQKTPNQGFWYSEVHVHVLRLRIRYVRQDLNSVVSLVMTLVVTFLFGCVFSTILTGPPYIPFCLYRLAVHAVHSVLILIRLSSAS
jgi:hypothetical protein